MDKEYTELSHLNFFFNSKNSLIACNFTKALIMLPIKVIFNLYGKEK